MQLFKRIAFYLFIAASLAFAVWGYFKLKENKEPKAVITDHIPVNAVCIIETKNVNELIMQLTRQNLVWKSLLSAPALLNTQHVITNLDSLVNTNSEIKELADGNKIYWSFMNDGKTTGSIIQLKLKEKSNEKTVLEFFGMVFKKDNSVSIAETYEFIIDKQQWFACYKNGIVYLSTDLSLIQQCVTLKKEESISVNKNYLELLKINGSQNVQVYFNHSYATLFDKELFRQQSFFNVEIQLNEITFNGYTIQDSLSFLNVLSNQEESSIRHFENLPNNPSSLKAISVSDAKSFYKRLEKIIPESIEEKNSVAWKILSDSALYDLKSEFLENIDREIVTGNYILENNPYQITSIKIKDTDKASQLLRYMSDSITGSEEAHIYKLNSEFQLLFSLFETEKLNRYGLLMDNALYFFSDEKALSYFNQSVASSNLIGKNSAFMGYATDNLLQECNYLYYENVEQTKQYNLGSFFNSEELVKTDKALSYISLTTKNYNSHIQVRLNVSHEQETSHESNTSSNILWSFDADSSIVSPVSIFTNHLTQENELCFQDNENTVYLVGCTGGLVWKKEISEKIISEIYTVDIFKNGKLQLLFNTENYIHLLDRNGNYVQGYPVRSPAKITSNITLLDYDHTKDYRLYFACADKKIYNYTLYGIKTEGFIPVKTNAQVTMPIRYVKIGLSDYLITADVAGNIYAFSRKGEGRIDFKNRTIEDLDNLYVMTGNNLDNTKLIYVDDKNNLLNKISLTDKKEVVKLGDELHGFKTTFELINDDTQMDVLLYGDGAVYAYDLFSSKLVESFNEPAVYRDAQIVNTTDNQYIMAFDKAGQKVNVIAMDGKIQSVIAEVTQNPLVSNLYKNGKMYVLIVYRNRISCQELN